MSEALQSYFLVCRTVSHTVALALGPVVEILRALPTEAVTSAPDFVRGICVLRSEPVPVIDLERLMGRSRDAEPTRFILLRVQNRGFALAVAGVDGLCEFAPEDCVELPPLLESGDDRAVKALAQRDQELFAVLDAARLLPPSSWHQLQRSGGGREID